MIKSFKWRDIEADPSLIEGGTFLSQSSDIKTSHYEFPDPESEAKAKPSKEPKAGAPKAGSKK